MKYIYIDHIEDRIVCICPKRSDLHFSSSNLTEYSVPDDMDLSKDMINENGETECLDGFLTASEFLDRYNADHAARRAGEYPPIEDQLDALWKGGDALAEMADRIASVKVKHPKP